MRIPEILDQLKQLDTPVLDRHMCELLFGVRRRRAVELMQRFDGYMAGNTIVLDRAELIASLERLLGSRAPLRVQAQPWTPQRTTTNQPT